jgi:hypothetical protein
MKVEVAEPRWTLTEESNRRRFVIPAKRSWFLILFLGFWLCGWAVGGIRSTPSVRQSQPAYESGGQPNHARAA